MQKLCKNYSKTMQKRKFFIFVTETISRTDEGQPRPKYIFNKCGTNIYFFTLQRFGPTYSPNFKCTVLYNEGVRTLYNIGCTVLYNLGVRTLYSIGCTVLYNLGVWTLYPIGCTVLYNLILVVLYCII